MPKQRASCAADWFGTARRRKRKDRSKGSTRLRKTICLCRPFSPSRVRNCGGLSPEMLRHAAAVFVPTALDLAKAFYQLAFLIADERHMSAEHVGGVPLSGPGPLGQPSDSMAQSGPKRRRAKNVRLIAGLFAISSFLAEIAQSHASPVLMSIGCSQAPVASGVIAPQHTARRIGIPPPSVPIFAEALAVQKPEWTLAAQTIQIGAQNQTFETEF